MLVSISRASSNQELVYCSIRHLECVYESSVSASSTGSCGGCKYQCARGKAKKECN